MMIFWLVVIVGGFYLFNRFQGRGRGWEGHETLGDTPLGILERRFANGEITEEQFRSMKEALRKG